MTISEYKAIQKFLSESCGIVLGENKQYLVENRLANLLVQFGLASFSELVRLIQTNNTLTLKVKTAIVDAMTTNETFWFRDDMQFVELREKIFPEIFKKKIGTVKVWSAACSSGQEPYSIGMCAEDAKIKLRKNHKVQIIGTDISETMITEAKAAIYSELAISRGLDTQTKKRFFHRVHDGYKLNQDILRDVIFQQFNLLKSFAVLGHFDVIFCRNVLIYFSDEVKRDILKRMVDSLEPGGYIFLSSTEAMPACKQLEPVNDKKIRYYRKVI